MAKIISSARMLDEIDGGVIEAVKVTKEILKSETSKTSEKLAAAKALVAFKVTFMSIQRQALFDKYEIRIKTAKARMEEIKLSEVEAILNPNATQAQVEKFEKVSRVFDPSIKPSFVSDQVAVKKEG